MLETNEGEREDEPMINALDQGEADMRKLFALRVAQLKASGGGGNKKKERWYRSGVLL